MYLMATGRIKPNRALLSWSPKDHSILAGILLISSSDAKTDLQVVFHSCSRLYTGNIRKAPELLGDIFTLIHVRNPHTNRGYLGF